LTVVGPTIYEADRMATAAFAMGRDGLAFLAARPGLEAYAIAADGIATFTQGLARYVC
jgi:thiamine biosynthesis lipoprotein